MGCPQLFRRLRAGFIRLLGESGLDGRTHTSDGTSVKDPEAVLQGISIPLADFCFRVGTHGVLFPDIELEIDDARSSGRDSELSMPSVLTPYRMRDSWNKVQ